jgi:HAD superfamily phosphatase (TIGR01668 family)
MQRILKYLAPREHVDNLLMITPQHLMKMGIRGIAADLDNTLLPWKDDVFLPEVLAWIQEFKNTGFKICIISNAKPGRVKELTKILDVPGVWKAVKPSKSAFRKALDILELKPSEIAMIGDQIFTDTLGGNRAGFYTILVNPLEKKEFVGTMLVRKVEKLVLRALRRRGSTK